MVEERSCTLGLDWDPIYRFNSGMFMCLSQARIFNGIYHGLFCVQWLKKGETFASLLNIHGGDIRVVPTHLVFNIFVVFNLFQHFSLSQKPLDRNET
jgi:hypothetical protein